MVSLPALLAEAPHIPYKLQLSLESCDPPRQLPFTTTTTSTPPGPFSDIEGEVWMEI